MARYKATARDKKEGNARKRRARRQKGRSRAFYHGIELFALVLLVAAAFFAPQMIFQVQDSILWAKTSYSERESMDVESLSTAYEKSLRQRMLNFAEGLNAGDSFYVAEQVLEVDEEIYDTLFSDKLLYQSIVANFFDQGLIPSSFYDSEGNTVSQWKQYVIYTDDYAKGVSFILWYIEVQDGNGNVMKLLADAEDGTLYALATDADGWTIRESGYNMNGQYVYYNYYTYAEAVSLIQFRPGDLWIRYALYYEAASEEEIIEEYLPKIEIMDKYEPYLYADSLWTAETYDEYGEEGTSMRFLLPYGDISLEYVLNAGDEELGLEYGSYRYGDVKMGFRQIYEMIPEFA